MTIVRIPQSGQFGVNKDLSLHELPPNIWTNANNIRFVDGTAKQVAGYKDLYPSPSVVPFHIMPITLAGVRTWIYAGATKIYTVVDGPTHTDISRTVGGLYGATRNSWTSCILGGIAVLNNGIDIPQQFIAANCTALGSTAASAWPATYLAKSIRTYKNSLIALNINKAGTAKPYMVKWSHPADPGVMVPTWDETDATKDAGETDLSEGSDQIIDGLALRDSFMIYKESSTWRMDYVGGAYVYRFQKVLGSSGALTKNCIVELPSGVHFVLGSSDCVIHDGQTETSVLDKQTRKYLFANIDGTYVDRCFVFINRLYNEVFVCYPSLGATIPDRAMVWNWFDKTVSFRDMPSVNSGASGPISDSGTTGTWAGAVGLWDDRTDIWDSNISVLNRQLAVIASDNTKLYLLDSGTTFAGTTINSYIERVGLSLGSPEKVKLVRTVRPRIYGDAGSTVLIYVGYSSDPYGTVTYGDAITYTIGTTVNADTMTKGRYLAVKFASGTASTWRLDSFDMDVIEGSNW